MTITIKTAISRSIQGGGGVTTRLESPTGPRNLLRLAAEVFSIAKSTTAAYGNLGHCGTWLEINGVRIDAWDVSDLSEADKGDIYGRSASTSRTEKARTLISHVQSGAYAAGRAAAELA